MESVPIATKQPELVSHFRSQQIFRIRHEARTVLDNVDELSILDAEDHERQIGIIEGRPCENLDEAALEELMIIFTLRLNKKASDVIILTSVIAVVAVRPAIRKPRHTTSISGPVG